MVLYDNVFTGQRVEARWNDGIFKGTVRYKGPVATKKGDWVGVELDIPVGDSTGMFKGRRYFQCRPKFGVFVRSDRLRFLPSVRCLYDRYHTVSKSANIDEHLFDTARPDVKNGPYDPINISEYDVGRVKSSLGDYGRSSVWDNPKSYSLRHSVSSCLPAVTMLRPETSAASFRFCVGPYHMDYSIEDDFERKPMIPKCHMPHTALKSQVRRGWANSHYVREMTVPTGRQKMKYSLWNDVY